MLSDPAEREEEEDFVRRQNAEVLEGKVDADVRWGGGGGVRASEYFERHPIRNVVAEDGVEIDWEGETVDCSGLRPLLIDCCCSSSHNDRTADALLPNASVLSFGITPILLTQRPNQRCSASSVSLHCLSVATMLMQMIVEAAT